MATKAQLKAKWIEQAFSAGKHFLYRIAAEEETFGRATTETIEIALIYMNELLNTCPDGLEDNITRKEVVTFKITCEAELIHRKLKT